MIRRSFIARTLGAIAGAVCAPLMGKSAVVRGERKTYALFDESSGPWHKIGFVYNPRAPIAERVELYLDDLPVESVDWLALHESTDGVAIFEARVKAAPPQEQPNA